MKNSDDSLLGYTVKCEITGFTGVVTGEINYLYGCRQVAITPKSSEHESKMADAHWIDRARVIIDVTIPRIMPVAPNEERLTGSFTPPKPVFPPANRTY